MSRRYDVDVYDEKYQTHPTRNLFARVYRPAGRSDAEPFPTMLSVHGGLWTSGSRETNAALDKAVAATGVLVVAIDFRQPPMAGYPASIADVHLAIRWLKTNAERFDGRADRVGAIGTSTGAHQVLLNMLRPDDPRYSTLSLESADSGVTPILSHGALCWPICDPLTRYRWMRRMGMSDFVRRHESYWGDEATMADGNPQAIVDSWVPPGPALPDLLIVQGTADANIPTGMTERFAMAYRDIGGQVDLHLYPNLPHGFITRDPNTVESRQAIGLIAEFAIRQST